MAEVEHEPKNTQPLKVSPPDNEAENTLRITVVRLKKLGATDDHIKNLVTRTLQEVWFRGV